MKAQYEIDLRLLIENSTLQAFVCINKLCKILSIQRQLLQPAETDIYGGKLATENVSV